MASPVRLAALPPSEAIAYFRSKGMAPAHARFDWRDVWREQHAAQFVVAKAVQEDVAQLLRARLTRALEEGTSLERFQQDLAPELERLGWWGRKAMTDPLTGEVKEVQLGSLRRLRVIFDTNMRTSAAAGRWARIQRSKRAFPYLGYRQIDRPTRREAHRRYDGLVRPVDDPIWDQIYPPNGWFCQCSVVQITQGQIDRGQYKVSPPLQLETEIHDNPRRGAEDEVPAGVDPGFDTNPGKVWLDMERRMEGLAGHPNLPVLTGLGAQLRLNVLREGFERGVYVEPDGKILAPVQATRAEPFKLAPIDPRLTVPFGSDFIHSHPAGSPLSRQDLITAVRRKMSNVIAVTPDGGVFSASPRPEAALRIGPALARYHQEVGLPWVEIALRGVLLPERGWLIDHGRLLWLERSGVIDYFWQASGAQGDLFAAHRGFLEELVNAAPLERP